MKRGADCLESDFARLGLRAIGGGDALPPNTLESSNIVVRSPILLSPSTDIFLLGGGAVEWIEDEVEAKGAGEAAKGERKGDIAAAY